MVADPNPISNQNSHRKANMSRLALHSRCRIKVQKLKRLIASPVIWPERASKSTIKSETDQLDYRGLTKLQADILRRTKALFLKIQLSRHSKNLLDRRKKAKIRQQKRP